MIVILYERIGKSGLSFASYAFLHNPLVSNAYSIRNV
jgi:hypothetical protein